jgi:lipoyl(octanoyl) transferase
MMKIPGGNNGQSYHASSCLEVGPTSLSVVRAGHEPDTHEIPSFLKNISLRVSPLPLLYGDACMVMQKLVQGVKTGSEPEALWFLEHQPVYTYGVRTERAHIAMAEKTGTPVCLSPRGGQLTFHGPGQRIVYAVIHLRKRRMGAADYVALLQHWIVSALARCGVNSWVLPEYVGVWTALGKVASIGVRVSGGVSSHGLAINVTRGGKGFEPVVPCGLADVSMTAVQDAVPDVTLKDIDQALMATHPF